MAKVSRWSNLYLVVLFSSAVGLAEAAGELVPDEEEEDLLWSLVSESEAPPLPPLLEQ